MDRRILCVFIALTAVAVLGLSTPLARAAVTRTLRQSPQVPAGDTVAVENLVGHMTVRQGKTFQVTATVVAGGDNAQALVQSIKLNVSTADGRVLIHVHYPVKRHSRYLYKPSDGRTHGCILGGLLCDGSHSSFKYQGRRVRVNESSGGGVPLYVDVAIRVPPRVTAHFSNAAGLLSANGLTNSLTLASKGGDIHAQNLHGKLDIGSEGGDVRGVQLTGKSHLVTGGGDAKLQTVAGKLFVHSGGGDLNVSGGLSALQALTVNTGGGDAHISGNFSALRTLDAKSGGGDILLEAHKLSLHLNASSGGGDINIHLPDLHNVHRDSEHFSADIGDAAGSGTLSSGGGDITVSR
jgi:hypothetical protein